MLANPPYGKSWKKDLEAMGGKDGMRDPRFKVMHDGEELSLVTRSSDGQMLFLANMASKMNHSSALGSRIAEVHNGSSLFTGDAGQGESNIRRWLIENDWLEAIVALPLNLFYNTGIATYVWVLSNRKPAHRRAGCSSSTPASGSSRCARTWARRTASSGPTTSSASAAPSSTSRKRPSRRSSPMPPSATGRSRSSARCACTASLSLKAIETLRFASGDEDLRAALYEEFGDELFNNFGGIAPRWSSAWPTGVATTKTPGDDESGAPKKGLPEKKRKKLLDPTTWERDGRLVEVATSLRASLGDGLFEDHNIFPRPRRCRAEEGRHQAARGRAEADPQGRELARRDRAPRHRQGAQTRQADGRPDAGPVRRRGRGQACVVEYEPDADLRDTEQVPLLEEGGIEAFIRREVLPYTPDAWVNNDATKIGYEISFTRHFYKPQPLRTLAEISADILAIEKEAEGLLDGLLVAKAEA
jgi:type I restriction enzyme M protein